MRGVLRGIGLLAAASSVLVAVANAHAGTGLDAAGEIAFASDRGGRGFDVYTVPPGGGAATRLTDAPADDLAPNWSPAGTAIAFTSTRDGDSDLYVMAADGSEPTRVTFDPLPDTDASWSPDGSRLVFARGVAGDTDLWVVDVRSGRETVLSSTPKVAETDPAWSPDGAAVAFVRDGDLYLMPAAGGAPVPVVTGAGTEAAPSWSPDGTRIAFESERDGNVDVYVVEIEAGGPTRLTTDPARDGRPAWSPEGEDIAFETDRDGDGEIAVMRADGAGQRALTRNRAEDRDPAWQPVAGRPQVDLAIAPPGSAAFVGEGILAPTGAKQTAKARGVAGTTKLFTIRIRNGGTAPASVSMDGTRARSGYRVRYLRGDADVTAAVVRGTYTIGGLRPGAVARLAVRVSLGAGARPESKATVIVKARLGAARPVADAVRAVLVVSKPAPSSYGWPVRPFFRQHPVRGHFGDPRIGGSEFGGQVQRTYHFGVDVSAPNGTPVYATTSGVVVFHPLHDQVVLVQRLDGVRFEYWHVVPTVRPGQVAVAYRTVVGRVAAPWAHVHFSDVRGGSYLNPLRPHGMGPYADDTRPAVGEVRVERSGRPLDGPTGGLVDLVAGAVDMPVLPLPPAWSRAVLTPALVRWRLVREGGGYSSPWRTAFDVRSRLPATPYGAVFAAGTRQNRPNRPGWYRFYLARAWDTRDLPNGEYTVQVRAADVRGNARVGRARVVIRN